MQSYKKRWKKSKGLFQDINLSSWKDNWLWEEVNPTQYQLQSMLHYIWYYMKSFIYLSKSNSVQEGYEDSFMPQMLT